jgi:hypothetical protein
VVEIRGGQGSTYDASPPRPDYGTRGRAEGRISEAIQSIEFPI